MTPITYSAYTGPISHLSQLEQPGSHCFLCYSVNIYCMIMCCPVHSKPFILVILMKTWMDSLIEASLAWFSNIFHESFFNIRVPHSLKLSNSTLDITSSLPALLKGLCSGWQPLFPLVHLEVKRLHSFFSLSWGWVWGCCPF